MRNINRMERFTTGAHRALSNAHAEAERLHARQIGDEHLLIGLIMEGDGVAANVLSSFGITLPTLRGAVEALPRDPLTAEQFDLSPVLKRVLEAAVDEARRMGHHHIGTEHLLLGMTRQTDSPAMFVLGEFGLDADSVRREVRRALQTPALARVPPFRTILSAPYPVGSAERMKVLQMIEDGKIKPEQGIELLKAMSPAPGRGEAGSAP